MPTSRCLRPSTFFPCLVLLVYIATYPAMHQAAGADLSHLSGYNDPCWLIPTWGLGGGDLKNTLLINILFYVIPECPEASQGSKASPYPCCRSQILFCLGHHSFAQNLILHFIGRMKKEIKSPFLENVAVETGLL